GRLIFPTTKGVTVIEPDKIRVNAVPPPVIVERFLSDEKPIPLGANLVLGPGKKRFRFEYTGLSFLSRKRVGLKYKLEGFDKDWIDAGTSRAAYYTNIPPGDYEFKVTACNNDGIWNDAGASIRFTLQAPWWLTWWAYGLYAISGAGFIYGGVR